MAHQLFELLPSGEFPARAVRESHETIWETERNSADTEVNRYRKIETLVSHVDCESYSTTTLDYKTFADQQKISVPEVEIATNDGRIEVVEYGRAFDWQVERIAAQDGKGALSRVVIVVKQVGIWVNA